MGPAIGFALSGLSLVADGVSKAQGASFEGAKSERAAEIGKVQADQISQAHDAELNNTIANIQAIRASGGGSPSSPSALAYIQKQGEVSDRVKRIKAGAAIMQSNQDAADAAFYRGAAGSILLGTGLKTAGYFATPPISLTGGYA